MRTPALLLALLLTAACPLVGEEPAPDAASTYAELDEYCTSVTDQCGLAFWGRLGSCHVRAASCGPDDFSNSFICLYANRCNSDLCLPQCWDEL